MSETNECPFAAIAAANLPIRGELQDVFDPVATVAARGIMHAAQFEQNRILFHNTPVYTLPYGKPYALLPPDMFLDEVPTIGDTPDRREEQAQTYADLVAQDQRFGEAYLTEPSLSDRLETLAREGHRIDPAAWRQYEDTFRTMRYAAVPNVGLLAIFASNRLENSGYVPTGRQFARFLMADCNADPEHKLLRANMMPVGEYGEATAARLLRTTVQMMGYRDPEFDRLVVDKTEQHRSTLTTYTARASEIEGEATITSTRATHQEGILTLGHSIALMTAHRHPDFDDPNDFVREILRREVPRRFTRKIVPGLIGPWIMNGQMPAEPLLVGPELEFSDYFMSMASAERKENKLMALADDGYTGSLHLPCPSADVDGAVDQMTRAFGPVYSKLGDPLA